MKKQNFISWVRIGFGALGIAAIVTQLYTSILNGKNIANFFSFFTIESNILASILFLVLGILGLKGIRQKSDLIRGAITLYMTMTGIIYVLLLSGSPNLELTLPWVNMTLHYILPVAILVDWLVTPPARAITYKKALSWISFPIAYVAYSFIRGAIISWYPYPFLDPGQSGWGYVIIMSLIITGGVLILIKLLTLRFQKK
ncbi:MAG TPA: Pr6Pr family membrane protein [Candidatus Saccharimonadales bacterium]|nr:Pr6Pr family membrane protein [Candidatus Saccharimonadales bacterium]